MVGMVLELTETEIRLIDGVKIDITKKLKGGEDADRRAVAFHMTVGKLAQEAKRISALNRIKFLALNINRSHAAEVFLNALFSHAEDNIFIPGGNWTILSFHDAEGRILNQSTTTADSQVLLPVGTVTSDWAETARREQHITFAKIRVRVDLQPITNKPDSVVYLDTFVQLPQQARMIKDAGGNDITVRTYYGDANLKAMPADRFKATILDATGQQGAADLDQASFTATGATLNEDKMQEKHREHICKSCMKFLLEVYTTPSVPILITSQRKRLRGSNRFSQMRSQGTEEDCP